MYFTETDKMSLISLETLFHSKSPDMYSQVSHGYPATGLLFLLAALPDIEPLNLSSSSPPLLDLSLSLLIPSLLS